MSEVLYRGRNGATIHLLNDSGEVACGRITAAKCQPIDENSPLPRRVTRCSWCPNALTRRTHRATKVCTECGQPWPCPDARDEFYCQATTGTGQSCTKQATIEGYCRTHWKMLD